MMRFEFATAGRIVFGRGTARETAPAARSFGAHVLYVAGFDAPAHLEPAATLRVEGEPTIQLVREGSERARAAGCDVVVAIGGGSAIDTGKAVAALVANGGDPLDYLEVIGSGQPLTKPSIPFIAVPTTAGTGAEVTRNAVLASPEHRVKASLRSPHMLPRVAIVDPELTIGLPPAVTASTGLDALTQLIEPYVSVRANPMTDMFCLEGMARAGRALERAFNNGNDIDARTDMAFASLLGGLALANAGLGAVHGFAAPIGGAFDAPHGAVCAALLPHAMEVNIKALRARAPETDALARYAVISRVLTGSSGASAEDGIEAVARLCEAVKIPKLRGWGVSENDVPALREKAARASSMKGNPIQLTPGELDEILTRSL